MPVNETKKDSSRPWFVERRRKHGYENTRYRANDRPYHVLLSVLKPRGCKILPSQHYAFMLLHFVIYLQQDLYYIFRNLTYHIALNNSKCPREKQYM